MKKILKYLFIFASLTSFGQYDVESIKSDSIDTESSSFFSKIKPRIYIGGEVSLSFGENRSFFSISPLIGYDLTQQLSVGISGLYQFSRQLLNTKFYNFNSYGAGTFIRFRPIEQLILQTEFDMFNTPNLTSINDRVNVPAFMLGAGYANQMGPGTYYQILLMYDFINDPNIPLAPFIFTPIHLKFGIIWHIDASY